MFTLSKKLSAPNAMALLFAAGLWCTAIHAQTLTVTAMAIPPYGPQISDYTQRPGRLQVTITSISFTGNAPLSIYVEGALSSMDGNIRIFTRPGSKAGGSISMTSNSTHIMTAPEIAALFTDQALVYQGVSRSQVLKNGLPEGSYRFCFKVVRSAGDSLSEGCSNMFSFATIEPPIIIAPPNNAEIQSQGPQNIVFQWTIPPQAPAGTNYMLTILEMDKPDRNPDNAFNSTGYPVFFHTTVASPVYLYSVANPPLVPGRKYTFRVTAFVPNTVSATRAGNGTSSIFSNHGNSEIFSFTYTKPPQGPGAVPQQGGGKLSILVPASNHPDSAVYVSESKSLYFRWTLNDTAGYGKNTDLIFGKKSSSQPDKDTMVMPGSKYRVDFYAFPGDSNHVFHTEYVGSKKPFFQASATDADKFLVDGKSYGFTVTLFDSSSLQTIAVSNKCRFKYKKVKAAKTVSTIIKGTLKYQFEGETESYAIPHVVIHSSAGLHLKTKDGGDFDIDNSASGLINQKYRKYLSDNLFTVETDGNGKFLFPFTFTDSTKFGAIDTSYSGTVNGKTVTGSLYYTVRITLESPYYHQPQQDIIISKADTTDAGVVTTCVKGYSLKAFVSRGYSATSQVTQQIIGKSIYLYRKKNSLGTPPNEGTKNMAVFSAGEMFGYYTLIGEETAIADKDKDGNNTASVTFTRLVANKLPGDEYYMLIKGSDSKTAQKISFDIERKGGGVFDSMKVLAPMTGFNAAQFGGNYTKGVQIVGPSIDPGPWINSSDFGLGLFTTLPQTTGTSQGGQHVMSLQTSGTQGKTDADKTFSAMAGTNFTIQSFSGTGGAGNSANVVPNGSLFNNLEAMASYPIIKKEGACGFSVKTVYRIVTDQYPTSKIKGKLTYTWAGKPGYAKPLVGRTITLVECLVSDDAPGKTKALLKPAGWQSYEIVATTLKSAVTQSDGSFAIEFNNTFLGYGKPYTNPKPYEAGPYFYCTGTKFTTTKETSAYFSNVSIERSPYSGTVKKVLRILIEDWSNDNYVGINLSPDNDFIVNPLDSLDAGTLVSKLVSVGTTGTIKGSMGGYPPQSLGTLSDVECYLIRKNNNYIFPEGEGNSEKITGHLDELPDYTIIDKTETGSDGKFTFHNYLALDLSDAGNEFYFKTKDMSGTNNYKPYRVPSWLVVQTSVGGHHFNNEFDYLEGSIDDIFIQAADPIVKGKVISDINALAGINGAACELDIYAKGALFYSTTGYSHNGGYFELPMTELIMALINVSKLGPGSTPTTWTDIDSTVLTISKSGFGHKDSIGVWHGEWRRQYPKGLFLPGKQIVEPGVLLAAAGTLKGDIICKIGHTVQHVPAYLQFVEKKTNNTDGLRGSMTLFPNGVFQNPGLPALPGNHRLVVIPVDPAYFPDTLPVTVNTGAPTALQVEVFERLHRVKFFVKTKAKTGNLYALLPVKDAVIGLCDGQGVSASDNDGQVVLKFKNVSVDNLTMKISGPQGSTFIPKYVTFQNIETDTIVNLPDVMLEKGVSLTGKVTLNGSSTSLARVYANANYMPGQDDFSDSAYSYTSKSVFEAEVHNDGTFSFNALPPEVMGGALPVFAVYQPVVPHVKTQPVPSTSTMVGDFKLVSMPATQPVVLNLTVLDSIRMDNLWGFPIQPFIVKPAPGNKYIVWATVKLKGYSPGFDIINEENTQIRIQNIEMAYSGTDNGVKVYAPTAGEVPIANTRSLKLKYFNTFNTEITSETSGKELAVKRKGAAISGTGAVNGYIRIVDNSFKYPSSYLSFAPDQADQFYFYLPKGENTIYPTIDAFDATTPGNGTQKVKFWLKRKSEGSLFFKFIGFPATADSRTSFIDGDAITLDATLNATMKNAQPGSAEAQTAGGSAIQIHVPKLVLKSNSIDAVSGTSALMVTFKDGGALQTAGTEWKLEAKNWTIDPSQGGLISQNCILHTGKMDVPFGFFNLRSDFAFLNQPDVNQFALGGKKINFGQSQAVFGFNASTGSDKKGHWQLIVYPQSSGVPVGTIANLSPNLSGVLELETVSLLSNGEDVFTIGTGAGGMTLYSMADFKPLLLYTIADGFELVGNTSLKIPRVCSSLGAKLVFTNAGLKVKPLDLSFTGKGNIVFTPNTVEDATWMQKWETKKLTAYGKMTESGKLDPVDVVLIHQVLPSGPVTDIKQSDRTPAQKIKVGSSNTNLETISCAMHADASDWNNFTFEGDLAGFKGMDGKNHMKFTVYGEIKATGQDLKALGLVDNGSSSFSGMEISYENGRMLGTLSIVDAPFGSFKASGSLNILMDANGWLFYGSATAPNVPLPDPCQANLGILVGYYTQSLPKDVENTVLHYAIRKELPAVVKTDKLLGFFTLAGRDLPISGLDVSIDVIVASAYVEVPTAGIDGYAYMNINKGPKVGVGIDGKVEVDFGLSSITCTSLYGNAVACVQAEAGTSGFNGCAGMNATLGVKQEVPLVVGCGGTIVDASISQAASFSFSVPSFHMHFSLGKDPACSLCN